MKKYSVFFLVFLADAPSPPSSKRASSSSCRQKARRSTSCAAYCEEKNWENHGEILREILSMGWKKRIDIVYNV